MPAVHRMLERAPEELPLENQAEAAASGRGAVARNTFYLTLGQAATTALAIVFSAVLGRTLGATDFGVYYQIAAFSAFAYILADWGQQLYIIRELAHKPECGSVFLGTAQALRAAGVALASILAGLAAWALGYDAVICWYTVAFTVTSLPLFLAQSYGMVFRARDRMDLDALVSVGIKIALLAFVLAALALGQGLPSVLAAQALAGIAGLAIAIQLHRQVTSGPVRYSFQTARQILAGGSAFVVFNAVNNLQPYIDAVLLSKLAPAEVLGWYGAAKTIMGTLVAPALILATAAYPHLARTAANNGPLNVEIRAALRPVLLAGALAAVGTYLFADDAISIIYGRQHFAASVIILKVFAPGFLLLFVNVLLGNSLLAAGRAKIFALVKMANVVTCVALELVLIPFFQHSAGNGGIGVVAAVALSELVVFAGAILLLRRDGAGLDIAADVARALGAAALTVGLFALLPRLPFVIGVPLCLIVYLLCTAALGLVRRSDIEKVRAILHNQ